MKSLLFLLLVIPLTSFVFPSIIRTTYRSSYLQSSSLRLLKDDFPEGLDPYVTLRLERGSSADQIKSNYRNLSKKYHIDAQLQRSVLPGKCADVDEVREEWDKIKLSYELLSDRQRRLRWDRMNLANDPAAAAGRAVIGLAGRGLGLVSKGVFAGASLALEALSQDDGDADGDDNSPPPSSPKTPGLRPFPKKIPRRAKERALKRK